MEDLWRARAIYIYQFNSFSTRFKKKHFKIIKKRYGKDGGNLKSQWMYIF